ncbi:MAG TPA: hypothetical protein VFX12_02820 [Vicinamibacterales bacterium]|nr:hypothetical protein [Vicinamibacterales bacterium]
MRHVCVLVAVSALSLLAGGCGSSGGGSSSSASTPTSPTPPPGNHAPVISSATVNPTFGIASLTTFNFQAIASDPDGDSVSYTWNIAGSTANGPSTSGTISGSGGAASASLTVSDGKGGTASSNVTYTVGSMSGAWLVTSGLLRGSSFKLSQTSAGIVTGSFVLPGLGSGNTDPAQPGQMTANGQLNMRVKIAPFTDFNMHGTMDTTGRVVAGSLQGSGFSGESFTMAKQ